MTCNCQRDNAWVWIQDHPNIIKRNSVSCLSDQYPKEKCDIPVISQLSVDRHKDNSISMSWFIRNRTSIKALQILYYAEDANSDVCIYLLTFYFSILLTVLLIKCYFQVTTRYLDRNQVSVNIEDLEANLNYKFCIIALSEETNDFDEALGTYINTTISGNITSSITQDIAETVLIRSPSSECISFNTYKKQIIINVSNNPKNKLTSILNRRLGLIVGCVLGCIVFIIMVTVLLYTKIKERKRIAKSDPVWSEMNDYHSMASKDEILQHSTTASTDNILLGMAKSR